MKKFLKVFTILVFTVFLIQFSSVRVYPWFKHYGGTGNDAGASIQQTTDGGYIVAGHTNSYTYGSYDFAIYKLSSSGNKIWFKHYGGVNIDPAFSIQQTSDKGYVTAGYTGSYTYGLYDLAIYKLDSNGNK